MAEVWLPKDFQEEGRQFLYNTKAAALWWRMGRGKTVTAASAAADLIDLGQARRGLVVAPLQVVTNTWPNEFRKWDHLTGIKYQIIRGTAKQRRIQAEDTRPDLHFINWENLAWLVAEYGFNWPWDLVILDEASKVKNQSSNVYKAVEEIRPQVSRIIELTGSPATNGLKNVWAPVYLMDRGRRLGRTEAAFKAKWFFTDRSGLLNIRGERAQEEISERISDIVYPLRSAVTGDEPIYNRIMLNLPPDVMDRYKQLENQAFLDLGDLGTVEPFNAAAVTGKLAQYASGGVYTEHPEWVQVDNTKMKRLKEIVEDAGESPLIVAYNSTHERERILAEFPQAVWNKDVDGNLEDKWNSGSIPILVMHPKSGGHGLNLQYGGSTVVWFSLNWSLELFEQLNSRLHGRHGQTRDVIIHMLMANDTIDEEIDLRLTHNATIQEALFEATERRRKR